MTKWEEWLGLIPRAFKMSRTVLLFWVSALPSFFALPVATWLMPEYSVVRDLAKSVPWYGPPLFIALVWLVFGDVVRWHVMARELRRLRTSPLMLIFDHAQCADCLVLHYVRLGVWNRGHVTAQDAHVYVESLDPPGFVGKRELRGLGMPLGSGLTINSSSKAGHTHIELLSDAPGGFDLEIAPAFRVSARCKAMVSIEAKDLPPILTEVTIDPQATPPVTLRPRRS